VRGAKSLAADDTHRPPAAHGCGFPVLAGFRIGMTRLVQLELQDWQRLCGKGYVLAERVRLELARLLRIPRFSRRLSRSRYTYARKWADRLLRKTALLKEFSAFRGLLQIECKSDSLSTRLTAGGAQRRPKRHLSAVTPNHLGAGATVKTGICAPMAIEWRRLTRATWRSAHSAQSPTK
jgi:hypothetical protein